MVSTDRDALVNYPFQTDLELRIPPQTVNDISNIICIDVSGVIYGAVVLNQCAAAEGNFEVRINYLAIGSMEIK